MNINDIVKDPKYVYVSRMANAYGRIQELESSINQLQQNTPNASTIIIQSSINTQQLQDTVRELQDQVIRLTRSVDEQDLIALLINHAAYAFTDQYQRKCIRMQTDDHTYRIYDIKSEEFFKWLQNRFSPFEDREHFDNENPALGDMILKRFLKDLESASFFEVKKELPVRYTCTRQSRHISTIHVDLRDQPKSGRIISITSTGVELLTLPNNSGTECMNINYDIESVCEFSQIFSTPDHSTINDIENEIPSFIRYNSQRSLPYSDHVTHHTTNHFRPESHEDICGLTPETSEYPETIIAPEDNEVNHQETQDNTVSDTADFECLLERLPWFIPVAPDQQILLISYLVTCMIPDIQHPILALYAESGTGKTTAMKFIKSLLDPNTIPTNDLSVLGTKMMDVFRENYWIGFDNTGKLNAKINSHLCQATDQITDETKDFKTVHHRCLALVGVERPPLESDLWSRLLPLDLGPWSGNAPLRSSELEHNFDQIAPRILNALYWLLSDMLRLSTETTEHIDQVSAGPSERYYDFNYWAQLCAVALSQRLNRPQLLENYEAACVSLMESKQVELEDSEPLVDITISFMHHCYDQSHTNQWRGTASQLFNELESHRKNRTNYPASAIPGSASKLSNKLNRLIPILTRSNVIYESIGHRGKQLTLRLTPDLRQHRSVP